MNFLITESVAGQEHEELLFSRFSLSNYVGCSIRTTNRRRVFVRCGVLRIEITALVCQRMRCSRAAENVLTASPIADPRPWMLQLLLVPPCPRYAAGGLTGYLFVGTFLAFWNAQRWRPQMALSFV
jgi:hypothetical protein